MNDYSFIFEAKIEKYDFGKMFYSVVYPRSFSKEPPAY